MAARQQVFPVKVEIPKIGSVGVIQDQPGHELPPAAWTTINNMRLRNNSARRILGHTEIFATPSITPYAVFNVPGVNDQTFWFFFSLTKASVQESGVESDVTRAAGNYTTVNGRDWQKTMLTSIPIFNNGTDVPQWWSALSVSQVLQAVTAWPSTYRAKIIRSFSNYLFALNLTISGTNYPHTILVSNKADPAALPSTWDVTDATHDATSFALTDIEGGEILDALPLGSQLIIYKKNSTHTCRFQGGSDIWARDRLFESSGILASRCVCTFDSGTKHFVATQNDIIYHSGDRNISSVAEGKNKEAIFAEMDSTNYYNSHCFEDRAQKEVWFAYPTSGSTYPNKAFIYNYANQTSYFRDFNGLAADHGVIAISSSETWSSDSGQWDQDTTQWSSAGREGIIFAAPGDVKMYQLDSGYAFGSLTATAVLERTGLVYENDHVEFGQRVIITRIWPKITGLGKWNIRVGASESRDGTITWSNAATFDPATQQYLDITPPVNGRIPAVRFESQENVASTIEGYDLRMAPLGEF